MILLNRIKCNKCGDILISENVHDFKWCSCKSCAVDGGFMYLKRCGEPENWTDMSITKEFEWEKIASELYDKLSIYDNDKIEISKKDLSILLNNLDKCSAGWAYSSYHMKKYYEQSKIKKK